MPTVNSEIKRIIREKDLAIRTGTETVRDLLTELHSQVMGELGKAALGSWDAYSLRQYLYAIENQMAAFTAKTKTSEGALLTESWGMGQALVDAPLAAGGIYSGFYLSTSVLETMKSFTFHKIDGVSAAAWDQIRGEISLGILGGKTPQEVATAIGKNIDEGRFASISLRAETITKTEMGRAFSEAAQLRMEQAAEHVEGLKKKWVHAGHPMKARPTHVAIDGQLRPVGEPFNVGGVSMMFPRDPAAPIGETINCGCDHVPYHANWA